jgi:hypothetical protein
MQSIGLVNELIFPRFQAGTEIALALKSELFSSSGDNLGEAGSMPECSPQNASQTFHFLTDGDPIENSSDSQSFDFQSEAEMETDADGETQTYTQASKL